MTTLVYRYGLAAPHDGADLVEAQMRAAHEYRCALVRIERERRAEERAARSASSADLRAAEALVAECDRECQSHAGEILSARKASRKRSETEPMRAALASARETLKRARVLLYECRERQRAQCPECRKAKSEIIPCEHAHPDAVVLRTALDAVDLRAVEKVKAARAASGVYWGTYLVVDRAMQASRAAPLYERDGITPHDPPFPRWDGSGCVAVQFQNGVAAAAVLAGETDRMRIREPAWPEEWLATVALKSRPPRRADSIVGTGRGRRPPGTKPGAKGEPDSPAPPTKPDGTPARWVRDRAARHGELLMCVDTEGRGKPLWASWRLDYDRPLPKDARVTWAHVHRRMRGPHAEWSLCVTVDTPAPQAASKPGIVAVDLGWRVMGEEIRVAGWQDDRGNKGELRLTDTDIRALKQSSDIRSERDSAFDRIKSEVSRWVRAQPGAPDWMREAAAHMHSWRRQGRMVAFVSRWAEERPERGAAESIVFDAARAWVSADRHLWAMERHRDVWSHRRRREKYRVFAAQMAERYGAIVLEKFDLRDVAERAAVGEDAAENEVARSNRQLAAVSELRAALCHAVLSRQSEAVAVDAVDSTRTCPSCGLVADRGQEDSIRLACECGHAWDQDIEGAAPILLARYCERPGDAKILGGARAEAIAAERRGKRGDKHARAKRMGAAKRLRVGGLSKSIR